METTILIVLGVVLVLWLLRRRPRAVDKSRTLWRALRAGRFRPWDHETELVRLCHGDRALAERLISHELERSPGMSRPGAALAAATRLRHDKQR